MSKAVKTNRSAAHIKIGNDDQGNVYLIGSWERRPAVLSLFLDELTGSPWVRIEPPAPPDGYQEWPFDERSVPGATVTFTLTNATATYRIIKRDVLRELFILELLTESYTERIDDWGAWCEVRVAERT